ncbi:hypothetical protein HK104_004144, partial [Borealophlyctis nickersoniae]
LKHCDLYGQLQVAARPSWQSAGNYLGISQRIYTAVHDFLAGQNGSTDVTTVLQRLSVDVEVLAGTYVDPSKGPPVYIEWTSVLGLMMVSLHVLALLLFAATAVFLLWYRNLRMVRKSFPYFCVLMIIGAMTNLSTIFVYTGYPTNLTCILQPWMLCLSFSFTMIALLEKNWRIFRIFNNPYMKMLRFSWRQFIMRAFVGLILQVAVLTVWTLLDPPIPSRVFLSDSNYVTCRSTSSKFHYTMIGILLALNVILVGAAIALAWLTRRVRSEYNEARKIGLIVWNTASFSFIGLTIIFIDILGAPVLYAIRSAILLETNLFFLICFFGSTLRAVIHRQALVSRDSSTDGSGGSKDANLFGRRRTVEANGEAAHMPQSAQMIVHTGTLVGRAGKSKLGLSLAPVHQYQIMLEPGRRFISILAEDDLSTGTGLSLRINTCETTNALRDADGIYTFGVIFNNKHSFQFMTSSKEVVDAWLDRFQGGTATTHNGTSVVSPARGSMPSEFV